MIDENDSLYKRLITLGDMMGDGLHHELDGKWIKQEYAQILKKLGIGPKRKNNLKFINDAMAKRVEAVWCQKCKGVLKQTRLGSMRARCVDCGALFQLMKLNKRKRKRR